ncbi:MAG: hypothetical protein IIY43_01145 [Oscillospiraceae bacterium]|nr:hypothetical protein [Oscillospiraceae bacterium]
MERKNLDLARITARLIARYTAQAEAIPGILAVRVYKDGYRIVPEVQIGPTDFFELLGDSEYHYRHSEHSDLRCVEAIVNGVVVTAVINYERVPV